MRLLGGLALLLAAWLLVVVLVVVLGVAYSWGAFG